MMADVPLESTAPVNALRTPVSLPTLDNPLLGPTDRLPQFDQIRTEHVVPAIDALIESLEQELATAEAGVDPATWESVVEPIERLTNKMHHVWGTIGHLFAVKNSDELRDAYQAVMPKVIEFGQRRSQSPALYKGLRSLRDSSSFQDMDRARQRIVESLIRSADHYGVGLEGDDRDRFNVIQQQMGELRTRFSNNVLDATKAFQLDLTTREEVDGLPDSLLQLAAQSHGDGATAENGPWRITLDYPSYVPFMEHSKRRDLRKQLFLASLTRASSGDLDNTAIVSDTLRLRRESAKLLGFENYAALSIDAKMAKDVAAIRTLSSELRDRAFDHAKDERAELEEYAQAHGAEEVRHWDIGFWAERLRESKFNYSDEELRPFFPLPRVLEGLFDIAKRLFGVTIVAADDKAPKWNDDVRYFEIKEPSGEQIASFYLDPYSRPADKRGGAWMDECLSRTRLDGSRRNPVAYLVCNQTPPVGRDPSLMTFNEVLTLFHEFGHGLQHMLTSVDYGLASGIRNVEWDAVELPSQFMENWCYQPNVLRELSGHYQTGESLPDATIEKLIGARTFRAASQLLRQLYMGELDLRLHDSFDPDGKQTPFELMHEILPHYSVWPALKEDRFLCSFSHVFAGGYAAGYYSYKWAEVLSADAFAAFEEAGLENEEALRETGRRFRETVLGCGGAEHPMEVFKAFRGREPSTEPLLRHTGLAS